MVKSIDKKEHILTTGLDVMKCSGYNGTSVKDIVDAANIPKGSFYNYFDSKESFAIEALEMVASLAYQEASAALSDQSKAPMQRLLDYFASKADEICHSGYKTGCFIGNIGQEMAETNESIRLKVRTLMRSNHQLFERCLQEASENGEIVVDLDVKQLSEFIFNSWEGSLITMKAEKSREPLDTFIATLKVLLNYR